MPHPIAFSAGSARPTQASTAAAHAQAPEEVEKFSRADLEIVDSEQAAESISRELGVAARSRVGSRYQPAYMDLVRRQLATEYSEESIATIGLRVPTRRAMRPKRRGFPKDSR